MNGLKIKVITTATDFASVMKLPTKRPTEEPLKAILIVVKKKIKN